MTLGAPCKDTARASIGADLSKRVVFLGCLTTDGKVATANVDIFNNPLTGMELLNTVIGSYIKNYGATKICIERPWISNNSVRPMSFLDLGRASAFVEVAALIQGLDPIFVFPSEWRKVVYGHGKPPDMKELARQTVLEKFGWETKYKNQHNEAESILLAHYGNLMEEIND